MVTAVFGADECLGRALEAAFAADGEMVIAVPGSELGDRSTAQASTAARSKEDPESSELARELVERGVEQCFYIGQPPQPVKDGLPIWIESFAVNIFRIQRALAISGPALEAAGPGRFLVIVDTPLRPFPDFDLVRGARVITDLRNSAMAACRSNSARLREQGVVFGGLYHPDYDEGMTKPTDIPVEVMAAAIKARAATLTLEHSGLTENFVDAAQNS